MFSERWSKNKDGYVPIDRNGKHFDKILDFLRDGKISKPNTSEDLEEIKRESEFYGISELSKCLEQYQKTEEFGERTIFVTAVEKKMLLSGTFQQQHFNSSGALVQGLSGLFAAKV